MIVLRVCRSIAEDLDKRTLNDSTVLQPADLKQHAEDSLEGVQGRDTRLLIITCQAVFTARSVLTVPGDRRDGQDCPLSPTAIVASDSPIKGIIFSRTIVADSTSSPRAAYESPRQRSRRRPLQDHESKSQTGSASPRQTTSPRERALAAARLTAELGFANDKTRTAEFAPMPSSVDGTWLEVSSSSSTTFTPSSLQSSNANTTSNTPLLVTPRVMPHTAYTSIGIGEKVETVSASVYSGSQVDDRKRNLKQDVTLLEAESSTPKANFASRTQSPDQLRPCLLAVTDLRAGSENTAELHLPISGSFHSITRLQASARCCLIGKK
jgi:hypothetical protein